MYKKHNDFNAILQKIEAVLRGNLTDEPPCLAAPLADMLNRGGKRWRPLFSLLVCEGMGGEDSALPLTPLIEFTHTASLIHDDIEDNSPLRRGKPSCHIAYGLDAALNAGSFLYFEAAACLDNWDAPPEKKARVYALWTQCVRRLHKGQALDINWHSREDTFPAAAEYQKMCAGKTGALSEFAAALGFISVSEICADFDVQSNAVCQSARDLGIAFQILDDVQNLKGGIDGKNACDDLIEGKKSFPLLLFLSGKGEKEIQIVKDAFKAARKEGIQAPHVINLLNAIEKDGSLSRAEKEGRRLLEGAFETFSIYPWKNPKVLTKFAKLREMLG